MYIQFNTQLNNYCDTTRQLEGVHNLGSKLHMPTPVLTLTHLANTHGGITQFIQCTYAQYIWKGRERKLYTSTLLNLCRHK